MDILVTGFEPFGGESTNPSMELIRALDAQIGSAHIPYRHSAGDGLRRLTGGIAGHRTFGPDAVVCVGQAGGRCGVTVERLAALA